MDKTKNIRLSDYLKRRYRRATIGLFELNPNRFDGNGNEFALNR
jgi:hypothetical protein